MTWQQELQKSYHNLAELLSDLGLDPAQAPNCAHFPVKVPRPFMQKMRHGDWDCPLLRQILPPPRMPATGSVQNPLLENEFLQSQGVLQKFAARALVIASSHCAVHCQYCFRQDFPYQEHRQSRKQRLEQVDRWRSDLELREVILSGGDPLSLSDRDLQEWVEALATLPQLKVIRFHTRFPIAIPSRLTENLKEIWQGKYFPRGKVIVVLHINHAQEIDDELAAVLRSWQQQGVTLLNQAVLLRGVNDDPETQEALWWRCLEAGVAAYYLHQMDAIDQAQHFGVSQERGLEIMRALRSRVPGYLAPRYVQEVPFEQAKVILT